MHNEDKSTSTLALPGRAIVGRAVRGFLSFFQAIFEQGVADYTWSQEVEDTKVLIQQSRKTDPAKMDKLPALMVTYDNVRFLKPGQSPQVVSRGTNVQTINKLVFHLQARIFSEDYTEAEGLSWAVFGLIPAFSNLLGRLSGIAPFDNPMLQPMEVRGSDSKTYQMHVVHIPCAVRVPLTTTIGEGSIFDNVIKRVTMVVSAGEGLPPKQKKGFVLEHLPADMLDVALRTGEYEDQPIVPAGTPLTEVSVLEQGTTIEEE